MKISKNYLESRTPANGIGREPYIQLLTDEFRETESKAAKHQISANLANFAYDPINFEFLKKAGVVDLFIELLDSEEEILVLHAISGISNICLDPETGVYLSDENRIHLICNLLNHSNTNIILNAITVLSFLFSAQNIQSVDSSTSNKITELINSDSVQIKNFATVLQTDYLEKC